MNNNELEEEDKDKNEVESSLCVSLMAMDDVKKE